MSGSAVEQKADAHGRDRQQLSAFELATVLSHFDIGTIESIKAFPRGSRKSPKLILRTSEGSFLLKRRAPGKDNAFKVAFCHQLQMYLDDNHFPLPRLIGTRKDNNSLLQWNGSTYELFEYIKGTSYDSSLEATADAGKALALFHKLLADFRSSHEPPVGSYHAARSVITAVESLPRALATSAQGPADRGDVVKRLAESMQSRYQEACGRVVEAGLDDWPHQIVHSDWHPGNMLFRGTRVVAVIDYDAARVQQRILDVANGALQFSILGGSVNPEAWPDYVDVSRFKRFIRGYESDPACVLSRAEIEALPDLMTEALIAECVIPIAATGSFARMEGLTFLQMIQRKVAWLHKKSDELVRTLEA